MSLLILDLSSGFKANRMNQSINYLLYHCGKKRKQSAASDLVILLDTVHFECFDFWLNNLCAAVSKLNKRGKTKSPDTFCFWSGPHFSRLITQLIYSGLSSQELTGDLGVVVHQILFPLLGRHLIAEREQQVLLVETLRLLVLAEAGEGNKVHMWATQKWREWCRS